jgi:hypothetical protein
MNARNAEPWPEEFAGDMRPEYRLFATYSIEFNAAGRVSTFAKIPILVPALYLSCFALA